MWIRHGADTRNDSKENMEYVDRRTHLCDPVHTYYGNPTNGGVAAIGRAFGEGEIPD